MATSVLITSGNIATRHRKVQDFLSQKYPSSELLETGDEQGITAVRLWQSFLNKTAKVPRVLVINNAHKLSVEAQNALLKILEEPPANSQIILEALSPATMLPTIVSRCITIELPPANIDILPEVEKDIETLDSQNLAAKFNLSAKLATDRNEAIAWLDSVILALHHRLAREVKIEVKITLLLTAKSQIQANCNVRLVLENAFLKW